MKIALACLCLLLSGCEATSFQAPPVAAGACDHRLVGIWDSVGTKNEKDGSVELRIDAQCMLLFVEHEKDGTKEGTTTQLHVGKDRGFGYLWVDSAWVVSRFDMKEPPPAGDIFLVRYRIDNNLLTLQTPDDKTVAHRIIDGKFNGEVRRIDGNLNNRVLAPVNPDILRQPGFFDPEKARLRRRVSGTTHG